MRLSSRREGEGGVPGGVYRGMRSLQAEESISEAREVKVEAMVMGSEEDSSVEIGWMLERESGRGELTRVELMVIVTVPLQGLLIQWT